MDRRSALKVLAGTAGASATLRCGQGPLVAGTRTGEERVAAAQPIVRHPPTDGFRSIAVAQVPIGAGGFVTGIDLSSDGDLVVCRTDVTNAYLRRRSDTHWTPLFTPSSMEQRDLDPLPEARNKADGLGVAGIRIAPSNKNIIYASFCGYLWKSADGGRTMRRTRLPQLRMLSNSGWQRFYNRTVDVDPRNAQIVVVGTWGEGAWSSQDGGERWTQVKLPSSTLSHDDHPGIHLVAFDRADSRNVYVFVTGQGLFRSARGVGGPFEHQPGGPVLCSSLVGGPDGVIYLCEKTKEGRSGKLWRFTQAGGWTSTATEREGLVFGIHPDGSGNCVLIDNNGFFMTSTDHGASFRSVGDGRWSKSGGEIRWMRSESLMYPAEVLFDPLEKQRLLIAQGVGVARVKPEGSPFIIEDWSAGIEELCATFALCVPGGKTYFAALDKSFWRVDTLASYTNDYRYPVPEGRKHDGSLVAPSSNVDYARGDPNHLVGLIAPSDKSAPGYTNDGGANWQAFAGVPEGGWVIGGCIAVNDKNNVVILPSNNGRGIYTLDGGRSWSFVMLDGSTPTDRFANAYYVKRKNLTADKERPGTFALVYTVMTPSETYNEPKGGLWLTRDGGRSWTQTFKGLIGVGTFDPSAILNLQMDPRQYWQCQLDYVPGRAGELVYTPHADAGADRFYWSPDDGATWKELHRSIRNVRAFGFGKPLSGQQRPALYFWGRVDGREGLYATFDWLASKPRLITRFPSPMLGKTNCLAGDPDHFGRLYLGTSCAGWLRVEVGL